MFNVIHALFFRELKTRFGINKYLGYFWVIGEPMMVVLVITSIIAAIREFHHQIMPEGISIFLFLAVGIIPFFMFRSIINQLLHGIGANLALFSYKPIRPIHVFIARALLEFCIYFTIFICVMFLAGWFLHMQVIPKHFLEVMFSFFLLVIFGFAMGMCFSIAGHFAEPLKMALGYLNAILYWTSLVVFPVWVVPKPILDILYYNPLLHIMELLKYNFFQNYPLLDDYNYYYPIACLSAILFLGLFFYYFTREKLIAVR
ncbi:ABC transporter permease [Campylobacter lari]|uniref:capsule polysaccharide transporter KpsM n=1 Tax=Campylobacter lari TaxID=201 RepID=UPI00142A0017|nr:ABC transporter permease [Campylobacter lari]EDP6837172.1 ABC transporter permease [Campylobacter lari]EGK8006513.1 ABC transporter permease [Campylobacter lari]EHL8053720.1 ABC transporter permease [Campylobacter lari]MCR2058143.1 ABC transporter permease [Campylobacter lari subsp. concheus]MCR2073842.1 ABC transporter permease [Campylobacter lari subsp. concheus]